MKNLFLALAFMLCGTFAFANEKELADNKEQNNDPIVTSQQSIVIDSNGEIVQLRRHTCSAIINNHRVENTINCFLCGYARAERRCQRALRRIWVSDR